MRVADASVGARGVDSYPFSMGGTSDQAKALRADGMEFLVGYLGVISSERIKHVLDAGMAFMPVTLAGHFDGAEAVRQTQGLGLPKGCTVWVDLEGMTAFNTPAAELRDKINSWADAIAKAGFIPGLYVGVPQPLSSDELWSLRVQRYWRGQGSIRDHGNALAEPTKCGWCMTQMFPQHIRGGVLVDVDIIGQDYLRRVPSWVVA